MRLTLKLFYFLASTSCYTNQLQLASENLATGNYKESIKIYENLITRESDQQFFLKLQLASALLKDQKKEEAFKVFLDALTEVHEKNDSLVSATEEYFYQEAIEEYLSYSSENPAETGAKMRAKLAPYYATNPDHHLIGFLLSSAYANLGMFEDFFKIFSKSYHAHPSHYLSFKTKAILYIKLFERAYSVTDREVYREKILENLTKALEKNPKDTALYKWLILFAKEISKTEVVNRHLRQIINENRIISRSDIGFYVEQAMITGQRELAQDFIDKTKEWYQYSRVINAAQEYLEQSKS